MTLDLQAHAHEVSAALQERLHRHRLVFVQHGAIFDGLTQLILRPAERNVLEMEGVSGDSEGRQLHVMGLERYTVGPDPKPSLGALRQTVSSLLDNNVEICLWSKAPRLAYTPVPGSSLLEDASPFYLDLLPPVEGDPSSIFPAIQFGGRTVESMYRAALAELGVALLASLDRAVFDGRLDHQDIFGVLDAREIEALRGAGLARCAEGEPYTFSAPLRFNEFREQLATALAAQTSPQPDLADISDDLWTIERTVRLALRSAAIDQFGAKWRANVLHGDLSGKVLERAMVDGNVGAKSYRELRDPIEWLSLGELIEVVTSTKFQSLGLPAIFWQKFAQDVLPVRNRLSHMRLFKHGDRGIVKMWASQVRRMLPQCNV